MASVNNYRCPVCLRMTASSRSLCTHMLSSLLLSEKHLEWIEAQGLKYPEEVNRTDFSALMKLVEKKCRVK
jgi:hypothetical protein